MSELDTIDQVSGNVNLSIPLASLPPGRGGNSFTLGLTYNSGLVDAYPGFNGSEPFVGLAPSLEGGWRYSHNFGVEFEEINIIGGTCSSVVPTWRVFRVTLKTPDGSVRPLALLDHDDNSGDGFFGVGPTKTRYCVGAGNGEVVPSGKMVYFTNDGSFIRLEISDFETNPACAPNDRFTKPNCRQWQAFLPDGSMYQGYGRSAESVTDRNGNKVTIVSYVDGAGTTITDINDEFSRGMQLRRPFQPLQPSSPSSSTDTIQYFGFQNSSHTRTVVWATHYIRLKSFICGTAGADCGFGNYNVWGVSSITFPQSVVNNPNYKYDFEYTNEYGWGELKKSLVSDETCGTNNSPLR